jgi:anti-sigma factor RsiW
MHLDEERLQRLLDGELEATDAGAARDHLATCPACRARLSEWEREARDVESLLASVDQPAPVPSFEVVMRRARMEETPVAPDRSVLGPRPRLAWRWAAALAGAAALTGAAMAVPGSPVRAWVDRVLGNRASITSRSAPPDDRTDDVRVGGIAVAPGERLVIAFTSAQEAGGARVTCTGDREVQVQGPPGAASFTSEAERLVVDNRGSSAVFEIRLPCDAPWVEIQVAGARVFLKEGERATPAGSLGSSSLLPLDPARR